MKKWIALLLCLSMALGLLGCVPEDREYVPSGGQLIMDSPVEDGTAPTEAVPEQELTLTIYTDRSTNPFTCNDYTNRALFSQIYQGLFAVNSA